MRSGLRAGIVALAATAVAVFGAYTPTARSDVPTLVADVGANDGYGISLMTAAGEPVTHLDPGTYTILVHDPFQD